jgi:hypothetical protein
VCDSARPGSILLRFACIARRVGVQRLKLGCPALQLSDTNEFGVPYKRIVEADFAILSNLDLPSTFTGFAVQVFAVAEVQAYHEAAIMRYLRLMTSRLVSMASALILFASTTATGLNTMASTVGDALRQMGRAPSLEKFERYYGYTPPLL